MKPPKSIFACQQCGCAVAEVARPLSRLRRVEFVRRRESATPVESRGAAPALGGGEGAPVHGRRHGRRPRGSAPASASSIACSAAASCRDRSCCSAASRASASRRCCCRRPRTSRRTSGRCSIARARNPSIRSRCAASGSASGRAPLYLLAETCVERLLEEVDRAEARAADRRLDPDRVLAEAAVGAGQRRAGAAGGDRSAVHREGPEPADDSRRPRHEGRQPRRTEGARARRRHRAVFRGRAASLASRRARREEPLRRGERARRVRDDRRRAAAGAESVAAVSRRAADERARLVGAVHDRRIAADPRRGAGARRARRRSATRAARRADSIRTGCRCCSRCSTSAPV